MTQEIDKDLMERVKEFGEFVQEVRDEKRHLADELAKALIKIDDQKMIDLSDNLRTRSVQLAGLWASLKCIAHEALERYQKAREK